MKTSFNRLTLSKHKLEHNYKVLGKNFGDKDFNLLGEKVGLNFEECGKIRARNLSTGIIG